ncbi:DUF805 domain-containing protein [Empedobacter sedimenti]|uniref:DUF805 domain-containing protein n=1 Tax=Empedobacter sedimenti TaxID=3042610 RepID=UPI0024A77164|nr:DUF805 domain-containing protein [Empedobacter sedimenti]
MIDWYKKVVFENYANFTGRARRSEYWYYTLCNILIQGLLYVLFIITAGLFANTDAADNTIGLGVGIFMTILGLYSLGVFLPSLAVTVRRLHDTGKSGWMLLLYFIPLIGPILIIIWLATEGMPGSNNWGPNPKQINDSINEIGTTGIERY